MSILSSAKQAVRRGFAGRDRAVLGRLGARGDARTAAVVDAILAVYDIKRRPPASVQAIEAARRARAADTRPLVDGSLGPAGPFDDGETVASACAVSKPPSQAVLLHALTSRLKPASVLELGTNIGISSAFLAAGLADAGTDGRILTLDVSPYRVRTAETLHRELGLTTIATRVGLFQDTLAGAIEAAAPIDMAFIDGNHHYEPTLAYTDQIAANSVEGALFVYDDIRWSEGMKRAWASVCDDPRFSVVIDLYQMGIAIYSPGGATDRTVTPPLYSVLARV
ncbi:putative O-methyltransferase YrrM [Amorphus suaedae]